MTSTSLAFGGDTSTAEHLFRQGLEAMKANKFKEACDAFAGSNEADPSPGTEINLALCSEKQGKLATAWGWYRTAAGLSEQRGQKERAELARAEAAKIEPKLHKLNVSVKPPLPEGLTVTRNGQAMPVATLGSDVPIDPGDYVIEVEAKGKTPWKQTVHVAAGPGVDKVDVPALVDAPADVKPVPPPGGGGDYAPPQPTRDGSTQRLIGYIAGGAGIAAAGAAVILEVIAVKEDDKSVSNTAEAAKINPVAGSGTFLTDTANKKSFSDSAASQKRAANRNETGAIISGIGAVVLIGAGITLILTAPSAKSSAAVSKPLLFPIVGRDSAGLGLVGTF